MHEKNMLKYVQYCNFFKITALFLDKRSISNPNCYYIINLLVCYIRCASFLDTPGRYFETNYAIFIGRSLNITSNFLLIAVSFFVPIIFVWLTSSLKTGHPQLTRHYQFPRELEIPVCPPVSFCVNTNNNLTDKQAFYIVKTVLKPPKFLYSTQNTILNETTCNTNTKQYFIW